MLKIAICDDNNAFRSKLSGMIYDILEKNDIEGEVFCEAETPEELYKYVCKNYVDVIFLDMDLSTSSTGLDLAKDIREINKTVNIVFITAHIEYSLLAFKVNTFDYLIKPITAEKLEECILRLIEFISSENINLLKVKSGSSTVLIKKKDIIYIEKINSKSYIYTANQIIETYHSLEDLEKKLPKNFQRSHKSYIVNINKILRIDSLNNEIIFSNSFKSYIGRKYKQSILKIFEES